MRRTHPAWEWVGHWAGTYYVGVFNADFPCRPATRSLAGALAEQSVPVVIFLAGGVVTNTGLPPSGYYRVIVPGNQGTWRC
jgi:hypothetical protein